MSLDSRSLGRVGALAVVAMTLSGIVAAAPAAADGSVTSTPDALSWGFKESFRNYVGGSMNTEPVGERVVPQAPAEFEGEGDEKRPYLFPVAAASVTDAENLSIATAGGVTYNFPSHFFTISVSDVEVVVEDGDARVVADLDIVVTGSFGAFEPGEYHQDDVHVADVADVDVTEASGAVTVAGAGLTLTSEGAGFLPYEAGDALDNFSVSALTVPVVEISRAQFPVAGQASVTVTGRGFYHGNAIGSRPPLAGKAAGAYVTVGYFAEIWRPSASAPSASRPAVSVADGGQKWAVPAASIPVPIAPTAGGIELEADGSFTTELTIDKADIDEAAAGKVTEGSYGIYTYPGSGAVAPPFETYSPIEFVTEPTIIAAPADLTALDGESVELVAEIAGGGLTHVWQSKAPGGEWSDVVGATSSALRLDAAYEQSGSQFRLTASNVLGAVTTPPATLSVTLAAPGVTKQPASRAVTVGSAAEFSAGVSGRLMTLQWQSRTGSGSWTDIAGARSASLKVAATLVSQSGTQYRVVATNAGGAVESAAATLTVTKAAAKVSLKAKKSLRFASKSKATVTVVAPAGVAATGAVVIKSGTTVVGKGTLINGKATVALTKKLRPGARKLVAEFAGSADLVAAKSPVAKVKVSKAAAKVTSKLAKKKVKAGKRAVLRVKVTASGVKPSGKVKVTVTEGKKKVRTLTVKVKGGKYAKVRLPKLGKGTYKVAVRYQGSTTVTKKSAKKVTLTVR